MLLVLVKIITQTVLGMKAILFLLKPQMTAHTFMPVFVRFSIKLPLTKRTFKSLDLQMDRSDVSLAVTLGGEGLAANGTNRRNFWPRFLWWGTDVEINSW